ncbi:jasmonate-induced oxygenase 2-like [Andrographis paniculata]|uniref:jasmonate-induced oxygenase 2-like n=1 Tax=Andrographis paniculata TaxID=175694 RepID=UPI0021E787BB|nr:jasmonate-induced oxygenase 2-like [Andrographis paniculata]XP_051122814.1 jasmonate-induced oxygenase 2-like [Andrographis paniculata]XP_051122815.1 jasmonate-induced oxygenase 2-like [Andrographis paniculata]XP_051122816.1 jasmonate-induced oxygenase 2-like [Andrographis paniculata]XP_051122817.1 jasmonate-induced oxygenase 2-like [Andrographis paniculata]XP_051122818.1 jasmonate-induced oxygenase 2-like [Andrographis paniculata]XP_051122819.1 jasmonate-induced oxygenase 2-like [Androgra
MDRMDWPEPIIRVQSLSDSGLAVIPERYIKPPELRPEIGSEVVNTGAEIPLIDLGGLDDEKSSIRETTRRQISDACRRGFFQLVNHGISPDLLDRARQVWREFFHQPMEVKQRYANSPVTYEGYGSRLGVEEGAVLDWSDYYFLHYLPCNIRDFKKWPALPSSLREVIVEYSEQVLRLGGVLLKILSANLGMKEDSLRNAFGGDDIGACLRVNFYPKCPQPELTYGLSPHSDPGGMTFLLPDATVAGLQVRRGDGWVTVAPTSHGIIVNMGDQIQVLTNGIYRSIEHRVIVNPNRPRISLAYFYNPKSDLLIQPIKELVTPEKPALYSSMTFDEYRRYIRTKGPKGKSQIEESSKCQK